MSQENTKPDKPPTSKELDETIRIAQEICVRWITGGHQPPKDHVQKAFQYAEELVEKSREYRERHENRRGGSFYG